MVGMEDTRDRRNRDTCSPVECAGPLHVRAHQRQVIDPANFHTWVASVGSSQPFSFRPGLNNWYLRTAMRDQWPSRANTRRCCSFTVCSWSHQCECAPALTSASSISSLSLPSAIDVNLWLFSHRTTAVHASASSLICLHPSNQPW